MNVINSIETKNHFILIKSQRKVEVVKTLFYFINISQLSNKSKRKRKWLRVGLWNFVIYNRKKIIKKKYIHKQEAILGKIITSKDDFLATSRSWP